MIVGRLSSLQEKDYTYLEYRYINKSGEICWVRSSTTAVIVNGKVIGGTGTLTDITARKLAETALLDSEEKYSKLFDTSPYAIMVTNATDGKIIEVNQAFTALSGYTKDEAIADSTIGLNLWVNPEDRQKVIAVLSKGRDFPTTEFLFNTKHNKTIVGLLASQIVYIGGKPHILSSIDDITDSKEANEKIRLNEEKYRTIFESVSDIYFETTIEGIILEVSPSIEVVSKGYYTRAELIGQSLLTFYGDTSQRAAFQTELIKQGHLFDYELQFLVKGGDLVPLSFSASLILDDNGNPIKIVGSIRDISERKKAEVALRESESLYKAILNTSPDNITITDLSGKVLFSSSKALEMFGYKSMDELLGINLNEFIAVEDKERATNEIVKMHQGILTGPAIYKAIRSDKTLLDIEVNGEMMRDIDGTPTKMVFVVRDVTERIKAEQNIKESEEKFRTIAEQTTDLISIADSQGVISYSSPASSAVFLLSPEEMIGRNFIGFVQRIPNS
jgi:PAS domain S-box-containing protein